MASKRARDDPMERTRAATDYTRPVFVTARNGERKLKRSNHAPQEDGQQLCLDFDPTVPLEDVVEELAPAKNGKPSVNLSGPQRILAPIVVILAIAFLAVMIIGLATATFITLNEYLDEKASLDTVYQPNLNATSVDRYFDLSENLTDLALERVGKIFEGVFTPLISIITLVIGFFVGRKYQNDQTP